MNANSDSTPRSLSVRSEQPISLRRNSLVSRGLQDITQLGKRRAEELLDRADDFFKKGDFDKALADYTEAIRLSPSYVKAYVHRGWACYFRGRIKVAGWGDRGEGIADLDKSIADYTEAIRLDSRYARAYYARGCTWAGKGDHDKAIADFDEAIRVDPKDAAAYYNRGLAWKGRANSENLSPTMTRP